MVDNKSNLHFLAWILEPLSLHFQKTLLFNSELSNVFPFETNRGKKAHDEEQNKALESHMRDGVVIWDGERGLRNLRIGKC